LYRRWNGRRVPPPSEAETARWRKQALEWLEADLARRAEQAWATTPRARAELRGILLYWKDDLDLAGIRDQAAIRALPEDEQKACRALWAKVDQVLTQTGG